MKTLYKIYLCLFFSLFSLSCSKWIDVKPTDRLSEDQLFVNKEGYLKALNGVYVEMTNSALYGQEMTTGMMDVMAQYYIVSSTLHTYYNFATFVYTDDKNKKKFDDAWRKTYELVANCNVIIDKCGDAPSDKLPEPYYGLIKGEALALRAFLQFDMLRLFGPIYTQESKNRPAIPYITRSSFDVSPILTAEQAMQHVIADLDNALLLMENTDPVRTEGVRNGSNRNGANDLYYRQYRFNYYAAKALLARAWLWQGNKSNAFLHAQQLLNEVEARKVFPYVTAAAATNAAKPDRVFSTEVMFSLYDINRSEMYKRIFDVSLEVNSKLSFSNGNADETRYKAFYNDDNDYRRRIWQVVSSGAVTALTNLKYQDIPDAPGRYMIPLVRLSEVLLVAAECSPDLSTGIQYLNKLRTARNCVSLKPATDADLKKEIGNEFKREIIGEGQQFFFYKRNAVESIPSHSALTGVKTMVLANYVVPLPDSETSQR